MGALPLWLFESQWDKIWRRPHDVEISPYDPDKNIRIVDANNHLSASSRIIVSSVSYIDAAYAGWAPTICISPVCISPESPPKGSIFELRE